MFGTLLLYAALATGGSAAAALTYAVAADRHVRLGQSLSVLTAGLLALALGLLGFQFATTAYANGYVWAHTVDSLPIQYRLAGVFAGVEGALLLWGTLVAAATARIVRTTAPDRATRPVAAVAAGLTAYFTVLVVAHSPFFPLELTAATRIVGPRGLNPLLVNPYMGIHPPLTFVGYAATLLPFSLGVVDLTRRIRGASGLFEARVGYAATWLRVSWVFLTAAIALGALWSYYTLGWGGLWAWDPVQTASLVAWVFVTAAVHALAEFRKTGSNRLLAVSLATLAFPVVVFVRLVTQSGLFTSVHSFGVEFDPLLVVLAAATFGLALGLPLVRAVQSSGAAGSDDPTTLTYAVVLLLALAAVYAWGVVFPVALSTLSNVETAVGVGFFNLWSYPFVVVTLLLLGFSSHRRRVGESAVYPLAGVVALTAVAALVPLPAWRFQFAEPGFLYGLLGGLSVLSLVPPAVYAVAAGLLRFTSRASGGTDDRTLPALGTLLVHVGVAVLVVSVPVSYVAAAPAETVGPALVDESGVTDDGSPYTMTVHEVRATARPSNVSFTPSERRILRAQVAEIGYPASAVPPNATGNAVVWGEVAAVNATPSRVTYRLQNASLVVSVARANDSASGDTLRVGDTLYAQGTLRNRAGRVLETDERFVGTTPTEAVVLDERATVTRARITVRREGSPVARGWVGIRSSATGGRVDTLVRNRLTYDAYVVPQQIAPFRDSYVTVVSIRRIPGMNGVRLGIALLLLGGVLRFYRDPPVGGARD